MDEKYYAFLMQKIKIDGDLFIYKPVSLIEGELETYYEPEDGDAYKWFVAQDGNTYCFADDFYGVEYENDYVSYFVMSEEELLEKYPGNSLADSKALLSAEVFDTICYGVCDYTTNQIKVISQSITNIVNKITDGEDIDIDFISDDEYTVGISFDMDFLDKLLSLKTYDEIISVLEEIKINGEQVLNSDENYSKKVTPNYIRSLFEGIYETLLETKDINEMKDLLAYIEESYIALTYSLDNVSSKNYQKVEDKLLKIADSYSKLQEIDNLKEIKEKLLSIKKEAKMRNDELASMYENNEIQSIASKPKETVLTEEKEEEPNKLDVKEMKKCFDDKIIGQEEAKRDVISAIYMNKLVDDPQNKNNCLLVGPTGSGKTLIAEAVAEYLDMPIEIIDATQLTMPGYVGANLEDFLERLLESTKGDLEKAENGIVVFDEIDKKGSDENSDVSGKGVLNTLLPFIGGTKYDVSYHGRHMQFNTSKLTIFATGAFTEMAKDSNGNVYSDSKIGFESKVDNSNQEDIKYRQFETEDFVKKGKMPAELIGRFSVITQLSGHTIDSLKKILTESNVSALLSEKKKLEKVNIELTWTDDYLDEVAKKAIKLKTGARSLKSTVDKSVKEVRWEVLNNLDIYKGIILTEKSVLDNTDVILVDINDEKHTLKDILDAKDKTSIKVYKKLI